MSFWPKHSNSKPKYEASPQWEKFNRPKAVKKNVVIEMTFVPLQKVWNMNKQFTFDDEIFNCELTFEGYFKSTKKIEKGQEIILKQVPPRINLNDFKNYTDREPVINTDDDLYEEKNKILVIKQDIEDGKLFELNGALKDAGEDNDQFTIYKKVT